VGLRKSQLIERVNGGSRGVLVAAMACLLAACSLPASEPADKPVPVKKHLKDSTGRSVGDPIAQASVNSPPGSSVQVFIDNGTAVTVKIGTDYTAADGTRCRAIIVNYPAKGAQRNAVCNENGVWRTVLNERLD